MRARVCHIVSNHLNQSKDRSAAFFYSLAVNNRINNKDELVLEVDQNLTYILTLCHTSWWSGGIYTLVYPMYIQPQMKIVPNEYRGLLAAIMNMCPNSLGSVRSGGFVSVLQAHVCWRVLTWDSPCCLQKSSSVMVLGIKSSPTAGWMDTLNWSSLVLGGGGLQGV